MVEEILLRAHRSGVSFTVLVLDARPHWEGKALWRRLVAARLHVSYAGMHSLSYAMRTATKVLMGAHACLSNGAVVSRAGSALVALCATHANVPVLIACETYKFAERVMLDSICANELGDPDDLVTVRAHAARAQIRGKCGAALRVRALTRASLASPRRRSAAPARSRRRCARCGAQRRPRSTAPAQTRPRRAGRPRPRARAAAARAAAR